MNNQDHYRISRREISILVISYTFGVGILSMPRALAQELETADGWITIMISGLLFMLIYTMYTRLQCYFPGQTLFQYLGQGYIGKWGAKFLAILIMIYSLTVVSILARVLSVVVNMYLLDQTPAEMIVATILLLTTYAVHKGLQGMIHLNLIFVPIILAGLIAIFTFNLPDLNIEPFRPVLSEGISPVLIGLKLTIFAFLGVEVIFIFMANMQKSDLRSLPLIIAVGIITLVYMLVTVYSYSVFSLDATKFITFPMLELAKEIEVPGGFLERLESLMLTIWIMTIFNSMAVSHYLVYYLLKNEFISGKQGLFRITSSFLPSVIQFVAFIVAFLPSSITNTFTFSDWSGWLGGFNVIAGLSFGYLTVWIRHYTSNRKNKGRTL